MQAMTAETFANTPKRLERCDDYITFLPT